MTSFHLIRHGVTAITGKVLTGRLPGFCLNEEGRTQARRVAERLAATPVHAIYSSPMERARESAEFLGRRLGLPVEVREAFTEVEFGAWSGIDLSELEAREDWQRFNRSRASARPPGGESILDLQQRVIPELERLRDAHSGQTVAVYSHGDPIRAALLFYLGTPGDFLHRLEIGPASASVLELGDGWVRVVEINRPPF